MHDYIRRTCFLRSFSQSTWFSVGKGNHAASSMLMTMRFPKAANAFSSWSTRES